MLLTNQNKDLKSNTTVSIFKNLNTASKAIGEKSFDSIFEIIRNNPKSNEILAARASGKYSQEKTYFIPQYNAKTKTTTQKPCNLYDYVKHNVLMFTPNGNFPVRNTKYALENPNCLNGFIYCDVDDFSHIIDNPKFSAKNENEAREYVWSILTDEGLGFIKGVWRSFGGNGFGFVANIEGLTVGNFTSTWESLGHFFFNNFGILFDKATKDMTRPNVISYDPNMFEREHPRSYSAVELIKTSDIQQTSLDFSEISNDFKKAHEISYAHALKEIGVYKDGNRSAFSMSYAGCMNQFGVPYEVLCSMPHNFTEDSMNRCKQAYDLYEDQFNTNLITNEEEEVEESFEIIEKSNDFIVIPKGKYLSDVATFKECLDKMVYAPAGVGKTTLFIEPKDEYIIFVTPRQSICDDIAAACQDVDVYHENCKTATKDSQKIATCVKSFPTVMAKLGENIKKYTIVGDEIHCVKTNSSKSFAYKEFNKFVECLQLEKHKAVIFCTATPQYFSSSYLNSFEVVNFKREETKPMRFMISRVADRNMYIKTLFENAKDGQSFVQVLKNNKGLGLDKLTLSLGDAKYFTVNADNKNTEEMVKMIRNREIQSNVQGMISTSVIGEGVNLNLKDDRKKHLHVVIDGNFSATEIYQFADRVRDAEEITIHILRTLEYKAKKTDFNVVVECEKLIQIAENNIRLLESVGRDEEKYQTKLDYITPIYVKINAFTGKYEVDHCTIDNELFELETKAANKSTNYLKKQMAQYEISHVFSEKSLDVIQGEEKTVIEATVKNISNKKEKEFQETVAKIEKEGLIANKNLLSNVSEMSKEEKEIRVKLNFIFMFEQDENKAFSAFRSIKNSKQAWTQFKIQIKNRKIHTDSKSADINKGFITDIFSSFTNNKFYAPKQINNIVNQTITKNLEKMSNNGKPKTLAQTTQILKTFFSVSNTKKQENGKKIKGFTIKADNPCGLNINTDDYNKKVSISSITRNDACLL